MIYTKKLSIHNHSIQFRRPKPQIIWMLSKYFHANISIYQSYQLLFNFNDQLNPPQSYNIKKIINQQFDKMIDLKTQYHHISNPRPHHRRIVKPTKWPSIKLLRHIFPVFFCFHLFIVTRSFRRNGINKITLSTGRRYDAVNASVRCVPIRCTLSITALLLC